MKTRDMGSQLRMPESSERPSFSETYRQQYRQVSGSNTSKAFRWITPLVLLVAAVLGITVAHGHSAMLPVILGVAAVLLLIVAVVMGWRQRARH